MHHKAAVLRKPTSLILLTPKRPNPIPPIRLISNDPLISSSSSNGGWSKSSYYNTSNNNNKSNGKGYSAVESLLRSLSSGVVVIGSSLGFCYWSSFTDSNSFLAYADSQAQFTDTIEKKPKFLFGGTLHCRC